MTSAQLPRKSKEPPVHLYLQVFLLIPSSYCVVSDSWRWNPEKFPDFYSSNPSFSRDFWCQKFWKKGWQSPYHPSADARRRWCARCQTLVRYIYHEPYSDWSYAHQLHNIQPKSIIKYYKSIFLGRMPIWVRSLCWVKSASSPTRHA